MTREGEPFWEAAYRDDEASAWGPASDEVMALADRLPDSTLVLDVGCGDGRNALYLAERGFVVRAFDHSENAIDKLERAARARNLTVEAWLDDVASFVFDRPYGLVLAEGVLHFVDQDAGDRFLAQAREHTLAGGVHLISGFTDVIEPPRDLAPLLRRLFRDGELRELYSDWEIEIWRSYLTEDEHPGGIRHRHAINDLLARKPLGPDGQ